MNGILDKLGRPLRDLRISVTDQCNLRCVYCMPKEIFGPDHAFLPKSELMTDDEIIRAARAFQAFGLRKVRLTGGEPLLRPDLDKLVGRLSNELRIDDISLTTNGVLLPRYAQRLKDAGLRRINISLDSLDTVRFALMSGGRSTPEAVLRGIDAAEAAALPIKINMVAKLGVNELDILPMVTYFRERRITLRFIEYMDVGESNQWKVNEVVPAKRILEIIGQAYSFAPVEPEYRGEVASRYRFLDTGSEFGVISSISQPFCQDCNRARLSANGQLFTCLFASKGHDVKHFIRSGASDEDLTQHLAGIWQGRKDQYSAERNPNKPNTAGKKIEMSYIGG